MARPILAGLMLGSLFAASSLAQDASLGVLVEERAGVSGVVVVEVTPKSPAADAGIAAEDVIARIAGVSAKDIDAFTSAFEGRKPGEDLEIVILKGGPQGERKVLKVKLAKAAPIPQDEAAPKPLTKIKSKPDKAEKAEKMARAEREKELAGEAWVIQSRPGKRTAYLGVMTDPMSDSDDRLKVTEVTPGSGAEKAGIKAGDIVLKVDESEIEGIEELRTHIQSRKPGDRLHLRIRRGDQERELDAILGEYPSEDVVVVPGMPGVRELRPVPAPTPPRMEDATQTAALRMKVSQLESKLSQMDAQMSELRATIKSLRKELEKKGTEKR